MEVPKATLYMIVGLPGAGKTTLAKEIEAEHNALRLTPDEWILEHHGHDLPVDERTPVRRKVEDNLWKIAQQTLQRGQDVVMDFGFWTKKERDKFRHNAELIGVQPKILFLDVPIETLWTRVSQRPESHKGTLEINRNDLEEYAEAFEPPTPEELA